MSFSVVTFSITLVSVQGHVETGKGHWGTGVSGEVGIWMGKGTR